MERVGSLEMPHGFVRELFNVSPACPPHLCFTQTGGQEGGRGSQEHLRFLWLPRGAELRPVRPHRCSVHPAGDGASPGSSSFLPCSLRTHHPQAPHFLKEALILPSSSQRCWGSPHESGPFPRDPIVLQPLHPLPPRGSLAGRTPSSNTTSTRVAGGLNFRGGGLRRRMQEKVGDGRGWGQREVALQPEGHPGGLLLVWHSPPPT